MTVNINSNIFDKNRFSPNSEIVDPNVVTDGLLAWVDPSNYSSYSRSVYYWDCGYGCQYYASDPGCASCTNILKDMSGHGKDASISNIVGIFPIDQSGVVIPFYGATHRAIFSGIQNFGNNTTWELWLNGGSDVSTYNMFMGGFLPYFSFYTANQFKISNSIGGAQQTVTSSASYTPYVWYHLAFTTSYSGGNTTMSIYVNGVQDGTGTFAGAQDASSSVFCLGDGQQTNWYRFEGYISPLRIYSRTLTLAEIVQNYKAESPRFFVPSS